MTLANTLYFNRTSCTITAFAQVKVFLYTVSLGVGFAEGDVFSLRAFPVVTFPVISKAFGAAFVCAVLGNVGF